MNDDPALDSLWIACEAGAVPWPAGSHVLFLRARARQGLPVDRREALRCVQSFKPLADVLRRHGHAMAGDDERNFALTLLLPPRQRDEARALFAEAVRRTIDGGIVLASQANNEGARSGESDLRELLGETSSLSKNHCRAYWGRVTAAARTSELMQRWSMLDAPRAIADGRFLSRPGVFSWERVDAGSALLAEHLPAGLAGRAADLGVGWGYLSAQLLAKNPGIVALDLYEAEARALQLAERNLADEGKRVALEFHWHDVAQGLSSRYDIIVSNPPFHVGRADLPELGRAFIMAAANALNPGGRLWMVANRHLAYEQTLAQHFADVRTVVVRDGFKVIEANKAGA
ncbi:class I SAM-dependent methyltransferase [Arenimonas sp.]|uniref:class I SAM-dependent methyltransferase n=1 Tax=Arenimonas sp. TaxID=1872635 RepID=UPI0039E34196